MGQQVSGGGPLTTFKGGSMGTIKVVELDTKMTPITEAHAEAIANYEGLSYEEDTVIAIHELAWSVRHAANKLGFGDAFGGGRGALEAASEHIADAIKGRG
jgi:hypothetical protein